MESCENLFMPSASIFQIINNDGSVLLQNSKNPCTVPLNVNECFCQVLLSWQLQTVWALYFFYIVALSLTLQELELDILFGLKNMGLILKMFFSILLLKMGVMEWWRSLFTKKKISKCCLTKLFVFPVIL